MNYRKPCLKKKEGRKKERDKEERKGVEKTGEKRRTNHSATLYRF